MTYRPNLTDEQLCEIRRRLSNANGIGLDEAVARHYRADVPVLLAEVADLRSRLACVVEATYWDRPYDERIAAIRGMCDLTTNGMTPIPAPSDV